MNITPSKSTRSRVNAAEEMSIVAFFTEPKTIDRILEHLRRTGASRRRQRAPPRRWKSAARAVPA